MNKENIKFSVMTPVYNVENYVEKCINSVRNQTYSNWELILVNDGSTDGSGDICNRYVNVDNRIKVFHKENRGLLHTRRYALKFASGDYFIFLDSDDFLDVHTLEIVSRAIEKYECDCVVYDFERVYENGILHNARPEEKLTVFTNKKDLYKKALFDPYFNAMWRKAVKKSCFDGRTYDDYYGISMGEDLLQSIEIYENVNSVVVIPDRLYKYYYNPESIVNTANSKIKIDYTVREAVLNSVIKQNIFNETEIKDYQKYCVELLIKEIKRIITLNSTNERKKDLLNKISSTDYYICFLSKYTDTHLFGMKDRILFLLFKNKKYELLLFLNSFIHSGRKAR